MKKIMLLLAICTVAGAHGESLLTDGTSWVCERTYRELNHDLDWEETFQRVELEVSGDTVVEDRVCKIVRQQVNGVAIRPIVAYEAEGVVYHVFNTMTERGGNLFLPYMDFNARKGDVLTRYSYYMEFESDFEPWGTIEVVGEEMVTAHGLTRRVLTLANGNKWVEGVGSMRGFDDNSWLTSIFYIMPSGEGAWGIRNDHMVECRRDGVLIWSESDFTAIHEIGVDARADNAAVYDLQGRRVESTLPGRIYVTGGRKVRAE